MAAVLAAALAVPGVASALTLDWDANPWPGTGVTTHTVTVDGEDVVIDVDDPNGTLDASGSVFTPGSLSTGTTTNPPSNGGAASLFVKADGNTSPDWITITFQFQHTGGVRDVAFSLFDVDELTPFLWFAGYTDELEIVGRYQGNDVDPTLSAPGTNPSWTALDARTVQGTRRVGETDENGTVAVDFGSQTLDEVEVTYRNALSTGQVQWIGFSQFTFSRAPEPSTAVLVGLGLVLLSLKRRRA